ncbi:hypothetical protein LI165_12410, partial [Phascolarctobacterium faecium]|uniref:hypothetical protein n=1 Tax=Phascolarctobacterium faecium TaxID=33025 RepID=UPI001D08D552
TALECTEHLTLSAGPGTVTATGPFRGMRPFAAASMYAGKKPGCTWPFASSIPWKTFPKIGISGY